MVGGGKPRPTASYFLAAVFGFGLWQIAVMLAQGLRGVPFLTPVEVLLSFFRFMRGAMYLEHTLYYHTLVGYLR